MKHIAVLLLACFVCAAPLAHADETSKSAKIEEMFKAANIDRMLSQMLSMVADQTKSAAFRKTFGGPTTPDQQKLADEFQDKVMQLVSETVSWKELEPQYVKLYAETFTEDEVDGILAFYKSPAGKAMVAKTPQMMTDANGIVQERMAAMQPRMQALMKEYADKVKAAPSTKQ